MLEQTPAQKWAWKRNWSIWSLKGIVGLIRRIQCYEILVPPEDKFLNEAQEYVDSIIQGWKSNNKQSKSQYLARL